MIVPANLLDADPAEIDAALSAGHLVASVHLADSVITFGALLRAFLEVLKTQLL